MAVCISACFTAPEFPIVPEISFNNLTFTDVADPSKPDSLIITINFKDGDGDLGFRQDESDLYYPYNDKFYFIRETGQAIPDYGNVVDTADWIHYRDRKVIDTLPPYVPPYKCRNWEVLYTDGGLVKDTVYIQLNPNHFNFFVDIYVQQPDQSFKLFDWATELPNNCDLNGFNGRFPLLSNDLDQKAGQEGKIRYSMVSPAWNTLFSIKVLKLHVWIQDRSLHPSNVVITKEFQLTSI